MKFRKTLLAATMLALPLAAQAQPVTGLYVAGAAGANWHGDTTYSTPANPQAGNIAFSMDASSSVGWVVLGSIGWGFGNGLRLEAEANYRTNDTDTVRMSPFNINLSPRSGYISTMGLMANVLYDIGATQRWPVHFTLGGGVGYAWHRFQAVGGRLSVIETMRLDGTDGVFAWQLIAGMGIPVRAVPGLSVTLEYRYFATADASIREVSNIVGTTFVRPHENMANTNQSVLLGVRYNFGQRPAAPPPPVVRPASSFIVFFDFNRYDLTARAREIVAQAAAAARSQQVTRIEVAGHTDTVGSAQYNLGLSQRRANTVAAELVRLGVPREAISTAGYGFSRPLVATGPNVREPQNRRVEIVFR